MELTPFFLDLIIAVSHTICANQDFMKAMAKRNSGEFRTVVKTIMQLHYQIDLVNDFYVTLSNFCKISKGEKQGKGNC